MNLFDKLVSEALKKQPSLSSLKVVVEKELLHHDIIRIMRDNKLIDDLTFIGETCLRACYGGVRLSEDLDFTGGNDFSRKQLSQLGKILIQSLQDKYGLNVSVSEPIKDKKNVDTWKIKIETRPEAKNLPAQRINIDICALPSYEKRPMMLLNPYGIDMGTSGLVIQAQSREEIYSGKLIAFALRPNRIKYRDLWDIMWLHGLGMKPKFELIPHKLQDRHSTRRDFSKLFDQRLKLIKENPEIAKEFNKEMRRFLPIEQVKKVLEQKDLWNFLVILMEDLKQQINER